MSRFFVLTAATVALFSLVSCSKESEDVKLDKGSYQFYELCMDWGASEDAVRQYVEAMSGWKEDKELEYDGGLCYVNSKTLAQMSYNFKDGGLDESTIDYTGCNDKFDQMKSDFSDKYGISNWEEKTPMSGVTWWTSKLIGKKTAVTIGYSEAYGGYMYITFNKTDFDF